MTTQPRKLVFMGDKTSNGGKVITASGNTYIGTEETGYRRGVLLGDKAVCGVCATEASIVPRYSTSVGLPTDGNIAVALDGDLLDCTCETKPHVIGTSSATFHDSRTA